MKYIKLLCLLLVIQATHSMDRIIQKQSNLPELPLEIWSKIFSYVPITHQFKQLMLAHNSIALTKKDIQLLAHQWYNVTQENLKKIPDDGSNKVNDAQKNYLQNALAFNTRWNKNNQVQLSHAIEKLIQNKIDNGDFVSVKNFFMSLQNFQGSIGYRIKRLPTNTLMTDNQIKLFLIAFNHVNLATLTAIDNQFPAEQVNGIGASHPALAFYLGGEAWGEEAWDAFLGLQNCNTYFEHADYKARYNYQNNYQKSGTSRLTRNSNPLKRPLSSIVDESEFTKPNKKRK